LKGVVTAPCSTWVSSIHICVPAAGEVVPVVTPIVALAAVAVQLTLVLVHAPVTVVSGPSVLPLMTRRAAGDVVLTHIHALAV
jgi:hypothetical protein